MIKDTIRRFGRIMKSKITPKPAIKGPVPPNTAPLSDQAKSYQKALIGVKKKGGSSGVKVGP